MYILQTRTWRDHMEFNSKSLEMHERIMSTDRAQRADEKNGVIYLVVMFTSRFMVNKMSKMAHFFNFLLMAARNK